MNSRGDPVNCVKAARCGSAAVLQCCHFECSYCPLIATKLQLIKTPLPFRRRTVRLKAWPICKTSFVQNTKQTKSLTQKNDWNADKRSEHVRCLAWRTFLPFWTASVRHVRRRLCFSHLPTSQVLKILPDCNRKARKTIQEQIHDSGMAEVLWRNWKSNFGIFCGCGWLFDEGRVIKRN